MALGKAQTNHDAVDLAVLQVSLGLVEVSDATVDDELEVRKVALERIDEVVLERRDFAVLLRREALEDGFPGVHDERVAAPFVDRAYKVAELIIALLVVDANAVLDSYGHLHCCPHRGDAVADELGLCHKAGSERAARNTLGRTADVHVDFVIPVSLRNRCTFCQGLWV